MELCRALSHILYAVLEKGEKNEINERLKSIEVVTLVAYLLQSEYAELVTECVDALSKYPSNLLKQAAVQVPLYFPKEEEQQQGDEPGK